MTDKAIRAAKLTLGAMLDKRRAQAAKDRAGGQIAPSKYLPGVPRQFHAYGGRANEKSDIWWHGSPSGDLRGGTSGLHLGTKEAALDALRARIGVPADGSMWDGTKEYGKTLLAGKKTLNRMGKYLITGHNVGAPEEDYYPHQHPDGMPTVGNGVPVDPSWKPFLRPFKIVGPMTNTPFSPHGDSRANAMMKASLTKGNAKNGYYYKNDGEDSGSISAVVPNGSHVEPVDQDNKYADGGVADDDGQPIDLGAAREQKQVLGFHKGLMGDIASAASERMEAHQKAIDAGVFDGYEVGDTLQGSAHPMRITGRFVRPWKPSTTVLSHFDRIGVKPTIIEHNGKQYIPMLRYQTGKEGFDGFQEGDSYLDMVKHLGYRKMGGLRAVKADGGSVADRSPMFEGMHQDLRDETGQPIDLYHGTPGQPFEAFDDTRLGSRDAGFYGRGHYLTPIKGNAEGYADPDEMGRGSVMGPMHAALKNPFIWDVSDDDKSYRTLKDLHSMGIMRDRSELRSWDNLQRHEINRFMDHMKQRGHDGVIMKSSYGPQEIVVFNPNMIKHRDAEVGDPNDPRIMRADGGKVDLYSKAARIIRGMKDQKMDVADILKYATGKGAKKTEIAHVDVPPGKATPSQVAEHIEFMQPQIGVHKREGGKFQFDNPQSYLDEMDRLHDAGRHEDAERLYSEFERFEGYGGKDAPLYTKYQLPGGENYREHVLTLDSHPDDQTYTAPIHWGKLKNPLAHIRMSDRMIGNKKILHIEELQSDWNNDARKVGFRTGREKQDYEDYVAQMRQKAIDKVKARTGQDYYDPMTGETAPTMSPMVAQAQIEKYQRMDPYTLALKMGMHDEHRRMADAAKGGSGVPRAPYINPEKDDVYEMAMKHVLMEAAKGGYDGIAFTPDEEQELRWPGHTFKGIYNKRLPGIAQRLVQPHDLDTDTDDMTRLNGWAVPMIPLSDKARDSITQNSFPSFRRGGYVTHVRRAR